MNDKDLAEAYLTFRHDPEMFIKTVILKNNPEIIITPQQLQVLDVVRKATMGQAKKRIAVKSGHGIGKTGLESWLILWFLTCHPYARVPCTAPTGHQLDDVLWSEVKKWWNASSTLREMFEWTKSHVFHRILREEWFANAISVSKADNLQGMHAQNLMFNLDEASGINRELFSVISGALTMDNNWEFLFGNPLNLEGGFYDAFHKDADNWERFTFSSEDSPIVDQAWLTEMRQKYPRESNTYRVRVLGEFPNEESGDFYIPRSLLEPAVVPGRDVLETHPNGSFEYDLGIDVARYGNDDIAFVISRHDPSHTENKTVTIVHVEGFNKQPSTFLEGYTIALDAKWHFTNIFIDETGIGGPSYDHLRHKVPIVPVTFNKLAYPSSKIRDSNKEAMYKYLKYMLELQRDRKKIQQEGGDLPPFLKIPDYPKLITQLLTLKYEYDANNHLHVHHPDDDADAHDDYPDALALSLFRYVRAEKRTNKYLIV